MLEQIKAKNTNLQGLTNIGINIPLFGTNTTLINKIKKELDELNADKEQKIAFYSKNEDNKIRLVFLYLNHKSIDIEAFNNIQLSLNKTHRKRFMELFYNIACDDILRHYSDCYELIDDIKNTTS